MILEMDFCPAVPTSHCKNMSAWLRLESTCTDKNTTVIIALLHYYYHHDWMMLQNILHCSPVTHTIFCWSARVLIEVGWPYHHFILIWLLKNLEPTSHVVASSRTVKERHHFLSQTLVTVVCIQLIQNITRLLSSDALSHVTHGLVCHLPPTQSNQSDAHKNLTFLCIFLNKWTRLAKRTPGHARFRVFCQLVQSDLA